MDDLILTLKKFKNSAYGSDGWRITEIKALALAISERMFVLVNLVEEQGRWPKALTLGLASMIPKGEGLGPTDLRPITVMPTLYRLWSATRVAAVAGRLGLAVPPGLSE